MTADEIASLLQREGSGLTPDEFDESPESDETEQHRVDVLTDVVAECRQLWTSDSEELDVVAQKLADGSRDAAWRVPYGKSGILSLFLEVVQSQTLRPALQLHTLRLIGNSCADTDENRARVVDGNHLVDIIRRVRDETLIPLTIPVLYNVLVDYEPAQTAASQANLSKSLTELLALPNLAEDYSPFINYICKIYGLLVTHEGEADRAHPDTVKNLLTLAQKPEVRDDTADFISLSAAASAYLASEALQKRIVEDAGQLSLLLDTVHHAHTGLQADDPEETESIGVLRGSLHKILSDVTALDEFGQHHPLGTPAPDALLSWLRGTNTALRSAACLALGNLCRSDETSTALVAAPHEAHVPLIRFLSDPAVTDAPALHAAMSFLKNLAIPVANKPLLGPLLEQDCVPRIYALDTQPQVQFAAASLTRILLVNCPPNVQRACKKLDEGTVIASLCALFSRTDAEPTKMEAARAVATLCRVLHSNPVGSILPDWAEEASGEADADSRTRANFYSAHDNLATPLSFLVGQKKWPSLRSEAWFILALMCRSSDGSRLVGSVIADYEPVTAALVEAVTGRPASEAVPVAQEEEVPEAVGDPNVPKLELEPQQINTTQKAGLAKVDRENTVVMLQEILRHWGGELPAQRAALWRGLVQEGTQAIVKEREGK